MVVNSSVTMRLAAQSARARLHARPARPAAVAVAAQLGRPQQLGRSSLAVDPIPGSQRRRVGRRGAVKVSAMVNVDISPSVVLGVGLIGAGVSLWQIRRVKPWISKDYDVVVSCISLLVGGILIFQGWRLDPLLLFGQLMTTGAAVSFAIEALRLRSEQYESEEKAALQDVFKRRGPGGGGEGGAFQLPPPDPQAAAPWGEQGGEQGWAAQRQWEQEQQQQEGAGFFDYQQPGSAEGYDPQQQQQQYGSSADAQWYYGDNGQYQVADYPVPGSAGSDAGRGAFASSRGRSDGGGPAEFVFPTSYGDDASGAPGDGSWGAPGEGQQPQWGPPGQQQQQQPPPAAPGRGGSGYEMDDW